jgi:hypothetical protein
MDSFDCDQLPLPLKVAQQPSAQLAAVGGLKRLITLAWHCQSMELAADQPAPWAR